MSTTTAVKSKKISTSALSPASAKTSDKKRPVKTAVKPDIVLGEETQKKPTSSTLQEALHARSTKQELVLSLLSRPKGACIDEIMQATNWQKHSVRGFLAGTVKRKLAFTLISTKNEGEERRYRIEQRRRR